MSIRSLRDRSQTTKRRSASSSIPFSRRWRFEPLEDRRLLSITVNTLIDEADGSIVDGDVSLRDAIALAPAGETINFSVTGTSNLSIGPNNFEKHLLIDKRLTINGPGANLLTINAFDPTPASNNSDGSRAFYIDDGNDANQLDVSISGLTLTGGDAIGNGGAIRSKENLTIASSTISGNSAEDSGGGIDVAVNGRATIADCIITNNSALYGGGISAAGDLTVIDSTISGNSVFSVGGGIGHNPVYYYNGGDVSLTDSTISGNIAQFGGGGIFNRAGTLSITNCSISDNLTNEYDGGGISSGGTLSVTGSIVSGNSAPGDGGGIFGRTVMVTGSSISNNFGFYGGGIYHGGNLTVSDSTISGNTAWLGGGIGHDPFYFGGGEVSISDSTISDNTAQLGGGGIFNFSGILVIANCKISDNKTIQYYGGGVSSGGTLTVTGSVVSGNSAPERGGGIFANVVTVTQSSVYDNSAHYGGGILHRGAATITGSTISGNRAHIGAGIGHEPTYPAALSLNSTTVSGNMAQSQAGGIFSQHGALSISNSTIVENVANEFPSGGIGTSAGGTLLHSIVARNLGPGGSRSDIAGIGPIVAQFSLIGDNTGAAITDNGGNLIGTSGSPINPLLGPLADNGGPTKTHALLPGSPAINAGDPLAFPGVGGVPEFDQRGHPFLRMDLSRIDIGAYERQSAGGNSSLVVDTLVDENDGSYNVGVGDLSLREAIGLANGFIGGTDVITFHPSLNGGIISLTGGELQITDGVTITGPGASLLTVDASGNDPTPLADEGNGSRVFRIDDGASAPIAVEIRGLVLTGSDSNGNGGAILNFENLTVTSSTISGNAAAGWGGGAYAAGGSSLNISLSKIAANSANNGGGVANVGAIVSIASSTFGDNFANVGGAIFVLGGTATLDSSTLTNNQAFYGGGVYHRSGLLTITGSTLSGNRATQSGGGINSYSGELNVKHTTIAGNVVDADNGSFGRGGGIAVSTLFATIVATLDHAIVAGNTRGAGIRDDIFSFFQIAARYSLIGDNPGAPIIDNGGNLIGTPGSPINPLLGPLADNGGPTMTHALLTGSPAIDVGDPAAAAGVGAVPQFDQRDAPFTRVFNGDGVGGTRIDIGALEHIPDDGVSALLGDYNRNKVVDTADYVVWRKALGTSVTPYSGADGDGDGLVEQDDYGVWAANFGQTLPPAGVGSGAVAIAFSHPTFEIVSDASHTTRAATNLAPVQAKSNAMTITGSAMRDARSAPHDSVSRLRERIHTLGNRASGADHLIVLLATDRVGRTSRQIVSAVDERDHDDHRADSLPSENLIGEPLAVALAQW